MRSARGRNSSPYRRLRTIRERARFRELPMSRVSMRNVSWRCIPTLPWASSRRRGSWIRYGARASTSCCCTTTRSATSLPTCTPSARFRVTPPKRQRPSRGCAAAPRNCARSRGRSSARRPSSSFSAVRRFGPPVRRRTSRRSSRLAGGTNAAADLRLALRAIFRRALLRDQPDVLVTDPAIDLEAVLGPGAVAQPSAPCASARLRGRPPDTLERPGPAE